MFDAELGKKILGKSILVGITYLNSNGDLEFQQQLHGIVLSASSIINRKHGQRTFT
jgi:hypothetical protein